MWAELGMTTSILAAVVMVGNYSTRAMTTTDEV